MPWKETSPVEERVQFVFKALDRAVPFARLCQQFGISRQTGYKWLHRYKEVHSITALQDQSRRPRHSPGQLRCEVEQRAIALRQKYGWGAKKLQVLLQQEGLQASLATLNRILDRNGLIHPQDRHRPATQRFERERPNMLWQMDFKGHFFISEGRCYPLSILDDHSRFLIGLYPLLGQQAEMVHGCLLQVFDRYGLPDAMLMDHGAPWWSTTGHLGLTWLATELIKQGIRLYFAGYRHPQTQGKVERFHGTLQRALDHHGQPSALSACAEMFSNLRHEYNYVRPHEGIRMAKPADLYNPSSKPYQPNPPAWVYPSDMQVLRLNSQGMLPYGSRRYFVCEALAREQVGVRELDGKAVVSYRHMLVREIDLKTKRTIPIAWPAAEAKCQPCPDT
jgi:transposase InsO family protein